MREATATLLFVAGGGLIVLALDLWSRLAAGLALGAFLILLSLLLVARPPR